MISNRDLYLKQRIKSIVGHPRIVGLTRSSDAEKYKLPAHLDPYSQQDDLWDPTPGTGHASKSKDCRDLSINKERQNATLRPGEEIHAGLLELFSEDAALPVCKPFVRTFVSTKMAGLIMAAELPCGGWECAKCGPKLKIKWYYRHLAYVAESEYLEKVTIDKEEWGKFHRKLNRSEAKYLKYDHGDQLTLLVDQRVGGTPIPRLEREYELVKILKEVPYTRQPVSQSRNWKQNSGTSTGVLTEGNEVQEEKNWVPLDSSNCKDITELVGRLESMGIPSSPYATLVKGVGNVYAVTFRVPTEDPIKFWKVLWALGVCCRDKDERRDRDWVT